MATRRRIDPNKIVDAALALAAQQSWTRVSLERIAAEAKVSLAELYERFPSKAAIVDAFFRRIDAAVLAGQPADVADEPVRERLLDVLMRRFEALNPHKQAVASITRAACADPMEGMAGACRLARSMRWSLEAAGVRSSGLTGALRVKGLAAIYLSAMRAWFRDDSPDMARTMAHLDRSLRRAEAFLRGVPRGMRRRNEPGEEALA